MSSCDGDKNTSHRTEQKIVASRRRILNTTPPPELTSVVSPPSQRSTPFSVFVRVPVPESQSQSVLLMELCAPVGQSAALDALLSDNDCDVIRDDRLGPRPGDLRDAPLPQSIAEHRTSVVLFSIGADALAPHSRFWEILRHFRGRVPIVVAAH